MIVRVVLQRLGIVVVRLHGRYTFSCLKPSLRTREKSEEAAPSASLRAVASLFAVGCVGEVQGSSRENKPEGTQFCQRCCLFISERSPQPAASMA